MSYTLDVYRGKLEPVRHFGDFALYVAFFPQLVAGPIERAEHLLPQVRNPRTIRYGMVREGLWLILLGYFKKVVLADNMAPFSRAVFDHPGEVSGLEVLGGIYAFAVQIYGDFSGYTDIARGTARLMGFDLMVNFRHPYFATSPSDFWRRWHISLSQWLRDNLYIPLGGNRQGAWRTHRNLMITMVLGGLWHGAAWNFVAWGVFHGALLSLQRLWRPTAAEEGGGLFGRVVAAVAFFHVTCFGWMLFGVRQLADVPVLLRSLLRAGEPTSAAVPLTVLVMMLPLLVLELAEECAGRLDVVKTWPRLARLACYSAVFGLIVMFGATENYEFIYFQF